VGGYIVVGDMAIFGHTWLFSGTHGYFRAHMAILKVVKRVTVLWKKDPKRFLEKPK